MITFTFVLKGRNMKRTVTPQAAVLYMRPLLSRIADRGEVWSIAAYFGGVDITENLFPGEL